MTLLVRLPRWAAPGAVALVALAGCLAVAATDPQTRAELSPGCPFRALTGWDCPGCGGTRAVYALTQGQLGTAVSHNLLLFLVGPLSVAAWAHWLRSSVRGDPRRVPVPTWAAWSLVGLFATFFVARNVPFWPLSWLASGS